MGETVSCRKSVPLEQTEVTRALNSSADFNVLLQIFVGVGVPEKEAASLAARILRG